MPEIHSSLDLAAKIPLTILSIQASAGDLCGSLKQNGGLTVKMKILDLEIQGYRSLKDVKWQPEDLNVVIGPNGTGKSNLLRLLEMISVSSQGRLSRFIQSQGGMEPLVWDGSAPKISLCLKSMPVEKVKDINSGGFIYTLELVRLGKGSSYRIEREKLEKHAETDIQKAGNRGLFIDRTGTKRQIYDDRHKERLPLEEEFSEDETLLSAASGPFTGNKIITSFQKQLASWTVYHDLDVGQSSGIRQSAVSRIEKSVEPDGQNLVAVLHTLYTGERGFKREIDNAMRAAFGNDFEELIFPPAADQRIQLRIRWKSLMREQSAADLSDGTLRFLLLLTILGSPSPPPLIAIDEPETGLHPSMLPIIAEYAYEASRRSQVIITTHSPQLLDAFGERKPAVTVTGWKNGETVLRTLGSRELDHWLREYSLGSLYTSGELEGMV